MSWICSPLFSVVPDFSVSACLRSIFQACADAEAETEDTHLDRIDLCNFWCNVVAKIVRC